MGHGWLNYAWKGSGPSGQKRAKLCSKNTVGLYGYKCAKEALAPHKETTTQCSKRYNKVRFAQVGEQCTSMCGVDTEEGQVISAVLALWAKWTTVDSAHRQSHPRQTSPVCGVDFAGLEIDHPTIILLSLWVPNVAAHYKFDDLFIRVFWN